MEIETVRYKEEESSVDWRGRPSNLNKHGGMRAAAFVLGVQAFEIMGIGAVGNNLITYVMNELHFSLSESANIVTNFIGTVFLLSLLGGYLSDSYLGCFWTMLFFGFVELSVFVAATIKRKQLCPSNLQVLRGSQNNMAISNANISHDIPHLCHTQRFRFLDKACIKMQEGNNTKESPWRLCTLKQVEQVKILISVVPIFGCTILFNTILAQLQTFSVSQGAAMNTQLAKCFHIPPASLQAIPYIMLIFVVPLYDAFFVPFARKISGHASGITPLQRIGFGLFVATFSMVSAAVMEKKRRDAFINSNQKLSIFWITPQFLIFGISEMFTAVGLIEFFYKQNLEGMQSFLTAMTYCSYSFGFYLSSLLVSSVNKITSKSCKGGGWLSDNDLNKDRLDLFYWLLGALSFINFLNYLFWARCYSSYKSATPIEGDSNFNSGDDNIA